MTVSITRTEFSAEELRRKAGRVRDANQSRRLLAVASVLDGVLRSDAARNAGMDRQTLRDWVHRYNAEVFGIRVFRRANVAASRAPGFRC